VVQSTTKSSKAGQASSMADLVRSNAGAFQTIKKGDIVDGTIKKLTPKEILLDIGAKGDALVIEYDKKNLENLLALLKVGDKVKASVISAESEEGFPVVSLRRMLDDIIYNRFEDATSGNKSLFITITDSTRGGYFGQTDDGIRGFLPNSQVIDEESLVGKKTEVKIIEFDRDKKRVIFSQKATKYVIDPEVISQSAKKGDIVEGAVTNVTSYGLYVTIKSKKGDGLIEGFIHISEIAYERVENLSSLYKKGDSLKAQVLELDSENRRVNLSVKKTLEDAFSSVKEKYKVEQKIKGKVTDVKGRGVTFEIEKGIFGFIPANKLPSTSSYAVGDSVSCEVTDIDARRRVIIASPILKAIPIGYR